MLTRTLTREPGGRPATNCDTNQGSARRERRMGTWTLTREPGGRPTASKEGVPDDPGGGLGTRPHRTPTPPHEPRRARKALTREPGIPRRRLVSRIRKSARRVGTWNAHARAGRRPAARRRPPMVYRTIQWGGPGTCPHRTPTPSHEPRRARKALTREPGIPRRRLCHEPGSLREEWEPGRSRASRATPGGKKEGTDGVPDDPGADLAQPRPRLPVMPPHTPVRAAVREAGRRGQRRTYADGAAAPEERNHNGGKERKWTSKEEAHAWAAHGVRREPGRRAMTALFESG